MPGYGESPMLAATPADAGDYADALARMLDRAGVEQTILVGHSLGALVAAAFAAKYPQRVLYLGARRRRAGLRPGRKPHSGKKSLAGASTADSAGRRGDGPRAGGKTAAPSARAKPMWRRWRRGCAGYAATVISPRPRMLAHDDIHRWLADYRGRLSVWCGEQDAITQPELVQGVALRYGAPYIAIPQAGHASYLDNEIFFNQQLLRIGEEVRDECTN